MVTTNESESHQRTARIETAPAAAAVAPAVPAAAAGSSSRRNRCATFCCLVRDNQWNGHPESGRER